jgi:hypothetical protein
MKAFLVSASDAQQALELAAALLEEGVEPDDLSVVLDEAFASKLEGLGSNGAHGRVQSDLVTDRDGNKDFDYRGTGDPEMERAIESVDDHEAPLYESEIGGGVSTATYDDDVSGVEEMDDSEEASEEMIQPLGDRDVRERNPRKADPSETVAQTGRGSTPSGIHGKEAGMGVGVLAALIPAVVPGVGVVMGDGPLAADLLAEEDKAIEEGVGPFLRGQGLSAGEASQFESALASGGAILEVAAASGEASGRQVRSVLESLNGSKMVVVDVL